MNNKKGDIMNNKNLENAVKLQSIAQAGLAYCKDPFCKERYEQIREIAAEMLSVATDFPIKKVNDIFCNESGYQTPKIDTRAAVFKNGKILLVHERNGTWSLPGGWCDVDRSVAENVVKETKEETGLEVEAERLIAVHDWRRHNVTNYIYGVIKIFMLCRLKGGAFKDNIETTEIAFFAPDELPENLATEKTSKEQIKMCFEAENNESFKVQFD